ncbi:MAG TPA: hypothetical protein VFS67_25795 [Polyangiaceae bacterium]|nr:hypothetical protein [Polyangiaceae bacterium]
MSARTVKAFEAHCAGHGRPVPRPVDITGRIPRRGTQSAHERVSVTPPTVGPSEPSNVSQRGAGEPLRVTRARQPGDDRLAVSLTLGELRELVREVALEAVAEAAGSPRPALLDRNGLAQALGVGTSTVDRFRREGMPALWAGDSPRFELADCLAWLRGRGQP